jgi:L-rhamnono-1,4-lactonase
MAFPIIDSHIHLFTEADLPHLTWTGELPEGHVLKRGNTVSDYRKAKSLSDRVLGFVFLETDRKSGLRDDQWHDAINEVEFLARIALGQPRPGEGHELEDSKLVLGVVPWAPVAAGPTELAKYVERALKPLPDESKHLVKGFRYLLQDKPAKTMLKPDFVESLLWLGKNGFSFDLGVDARSVGLHMLDEACELFDRVYGEGSELKVIINHFCKPNLQLSKAEALGGHPDFTRWRDSIEKMASYPNTYIKLSGFFSELPPQAESEPADISTLIDLLQPWVEVVLKAFTPSRILFGSDWPVCNMGGPGIQKSWQHWHNLTTALLHAEGLNGEEQRMIWAGTAAKAYNIQLPTED